MKIINYSAEQDSLLSSWLPKDLDAERVVFFPDAYPGKTPLPTGTAVKTRQENWRKFTVSDSGCGMLLAKSKMHVSHFNKEYWNHLYSDLNANQGKLGDLGGGNHFLYALKSFNDDFIYFLIHSGSDEKLKILEDLVGLPWKYDEAFVKMSHWAKNNRAEIVKISEKYFGKLDLMVDTNHNSVEHLEDGSVLIRKGAVKLLPGEQTVIPSKMNGDVVLVQANEKIGDVLNSMCHGTGKLRSNPESKELSESFDRLNSVYIPEKIRNESSKSNALFHYRGLDPCLKIIKDLVKEIKRFAPIAYLGKM